MYYILSLSFVSLYLRDTYGLRWVVFSPGATRPQVLLDPRHGGPCGPGARASEIVFWGSGIIYHPAGGCRCFVLLWDYYILCP